MHVSSQATTAAADATVAALAATTAVSSAVAYLFSVCVTFCEHAPPRALQTLAYCCHQQLLCAPSLPSFRLLIFE
jgi:hypothetical protein